LLGRGGGVPAREGADAVAEAAALGLGVLVEGAEVEFGGVGELPVEIHSGADFCDLGKVEPGVVGLQPLIADGGNGAGDAAAGDANGNQGGTVVGEFVGIGAPILVAVGEGGAEAEGAILVEHIHERQRGGMAGLFAERIVDILELAVDAPFSEVERATRDEIDRAAERVGVHVGREGLDDLDAADHLGGNLGEIDGAGVGVDRGGIDAGPAVERRSPSSVTELSSAGVPRMLAN